MARIIDNLIAYKMLTMLVTPFIETDAYKLGIIDKDGKNLIKTSKLETSQQRDAYTYLHRLIFNIKKILNRLPGGESKLKNIVAAFWLVKESYANGKTVISEDLEKVIKLMDTVTLVEEEIEVMNFLEEMVAEEELDEDGAVGGAPANATGAAVSTDIAVPKKRDITKYKTKNGELISFARRNNKVV